jgi:antitoxin VapB
MHGKKTDRQNPALKDDDREVVAGSLADDLDTIARRCAALPVLDARSIDEIVDYGEHGAPRQ